MNSTISTLFSIVVTQLPMLVVYGVGLLTAYSYRQQQPQAAQRFTWAILLFVVDATLLSLASQWYVNKLAFDGLNQAELTFAVNGLALARSLLRAWAFMLILGAVFPAPVAIKWPLRLIGGVIGLLIGGALAVIFGDSIGSALGVTTFEGARGYFVVFVLIPLFALTGAVVGVLVAGAPRPAL
jgi:hypothetical protein